MFLTLQAQTAAEWTAQNPTLEIGQAGIEIDYEGQTQVGSARIKFGDGITQWDDLDYLDRTDIPMDLVRQVDGQPGSTATILRYVAARSTRFEGSGHRGYAATVATANADFDVRINGVSKGTLRFAAGTTDMVLVNATETAMAVGGKLEIIAPIQDATLANLSVTLKMTLI